MTLTIEKPKTHLYHKYPRQTSPQGTYLELDPKSRVLRADWDGEIGGGRPMSVHHGLVRRYALSSPYLTAEEIGRLMDEIVPLAEQICDGWSTEWDGHNYVGRLTDEASEADEELGHVLMDEVDDNDCIAVWDAEEYFGGDYESRDEIIRRIEASENVVGIETWLKNENPTDSDGVQLVLENVEDFIKSLMEV